MGSIMINTKGQGSANIIGNAGELDDEMELMGMGELSLASKM